MDLKSKLEKATKLVETNKESKLIAKTKLDSAKAKLKEMGHDTIEDAEKVLTRLYKSIQDGEKEMEELTEDLDLELKQGE